MAAPIPISYLNNSGEAIPPFAALQLSGDNDVTATKTQSVKVVKPTGLGPYMLDMGQGTGATGQSAYGQCCTPISHTWWAYYLGASAPGPAWTTEIGPVSGAWDLQTGGSGFLYAGHLDVANQRILVMQKPAGGGAQVVRFTVTTIDCDTGDITGTVTNIMCSGSETAIGDTVTLVDSLGYLTGNPDLMIGHSGIGVKMKDATAYGDSCAYEIQAMDDLGTNCA